MAIEIMPSSYCCDCGHESHFSENTIREMKRMSKMKKVKLSDSENNRHSITFYRQKAIEIQCPKLGKCKITEME